MDTQPPLPPNLIPPSDPSTSSGQSEEKTSFAVPGSTDKSVSVPAHKASRIILMLLLVVFLLVAFVGVYALAQRFSVEDVYRWLHVDRAPVESTDMSLPAGQAGAVPVSSAEPTLTAGDSVSDIEQDLNATSLNDFDQEASSVKADVEAQN